MLRKKAFPFHFVSPWLLKFFTVSLFITVCCGGELSMIKSRKLLGSDSPKSSEAKYERIYWLPPALVIGFFILYIYVVGKRAAKLARDREVLRALSDSPLKVTPLAKPIEEIKLEEECTELVFFVGEDEAFQLDDLFGAEADMRNQNHCSSLYKVTLKNDVVYAVKRLKKLQVRFDEFGQTMRQIGNMKHPNILPLVAYSSTHEEKLLIYQYQSNGSLLNLLHDYIEGKKEFPWRSRLLIAGGIARGLDMIHQRCNNGEGFPHGNLKLSNILLDDNMEALISEYGFARFIDPQKSSLHAANGYTAPERSMSEASDVYSFGVILLELLTGKTIEKTGIDLPKWVKSMVSEEWTGEVFDKEVSRAAKRWAFSLLNIGLMCVLDDPVKRPSIAEVLEKVEEVINAQRGHPFSPTSPMQSSSYPQDCCLLHTVIPETWDTPGSNY